MVSDWFSEIKRFWRSEERCTAVLFGAILVMAIYRPDCKNDMDVYETFILSVTKLLREGRRAGTKEFFITGDLNVELGLLCTDEDDIGEFKEMYGPLCWQGCERDHGVFRKLIWCGIMKEFNCKVSTWSKCGRETETAFTHQQFGEKGKERKAQLHYIIGPRCKSD